MVYFKKNENPAEDDFCDFDFPELEGIFIIGDLERSEKMKKVGKVIAVISAVCAAVAGVFFAIYRFAKKQKA